MSCLQRTGATAKKQKIRIESRESYRYIINDEQAQLLKLFEINFGCPSA
jgi:hypothetical protein